MKMQSKLSEMTEEKSKPKRYILFWGLDRTIQAGDEFWNQCEKCWQASEAVGTCGACRVYRREHPEGTLTPEGFAYAFGSQLPPLQKWCGGLDILSEFGYWWRHIDGPLKSPLADRIYRVPLEAWEADEPQKQAPKKETEEMRKKETEETPKRYKLFWGPNETIERWDEYWSQIACGWLTSQRAGEWGCGSVHRREDPNGVETPEGFAYVSGSQLPSLDWGCEDLYAVSSRGDAWVGPLHQESTRSKSIVYRVPMEVWETLPSELQEQEQEEYPSVALFADGAFNCFCKQGPEATKIGACLIRDGKARTVAIYTLGSVSRTKMSVVFDVVKEHEG